MPGLAAACGRGDEVVAVPLADGGEGTAEALLRTPAAASGAAPTVRDALGRPRRARFALLAGGEAALDVAEACGRQTVADLPPDPLGASSFGAGQLIAAAVAAGASRIDRRRRRHGQHRRRRGPARRRSARAPPRGSSSWLRSTCAIRCSARDGAAAVFGPQKGATPEQVAVLERRLAALGLPTAALPGAGAGGGIGAMLMALGARR